MIIGVTDEKVSLVDKWVAENKPDYPIVILEDGTLEDALGVAFFPTAAVVDPEGFITYSGDSRSYSSPLKAALKNAKKGSVVPKAFNKFTKELKAGETGKAYDIVVGMVEAGKLEGSDLAWGRKLQTWLESEAKSALVQAKAKLEEGWYFEAFHLVAELDGSKVGYPNQAEVQSFLSEMEAADGFSTEMKGGKMFEEVEELKAEWEFTKAVNSYRRIYSKYPDSRIAVHARAAAEKIVDDKLPGLKKTCQKCSRKHRACSKHIEKVKL